MKVGDTAIWKATGEKVNIEKIEPIFITIRTCKSPLGGNIHYVDKKDLMVIEK